MDVVKIVRIVFGVVASVLLVGALIAVQHTRSFLADAVSARGTVQELVARSSTDSDHRTTTTYAPVVQFVTVEGASITFVSSTSSYPPAYQVGGSVEVLYSSHDPRRARIHDWFSLWGLAAILGGLGSAFAAVSGGLTLAALRSQRSDRSSLAPDIDREDESDDEPDVGSDAELRSRGVRVQADVQRVKPTGTFVANGSENHRIVAQWFDPDRHEVHVFTSDDIPFDPTPYLTGKTIDVYIAPDDPAQHYVDISFLPRAAS